jgi:hypothetical protein
VLSEKVRRLVIEGKGLMELTVGKEKLKKGRDVYDYW